MHCRTDSTPNELTNSRQNCKLRVQIDTIRQLITICTQSTIVHKHRRAVSEPASIHTQRGLFILYVKLNFHETRLNFSQSARDSLNVQLYAIWGYYARGDL